MTRRIVLDVDTGSDDAIAILLAGLSPEIDLLGCTTVWGNHDVPVCTDNTLRVLDAIGRTDVPVHQGLGKRFAPSPFLFESHVDSERGAIHPEVFPVAASPRQAGSHRGVEWLVETLRTTTTPITLVPVGPLTNIAAALTLDPSIVDAVDEIVIMGGAHALGNVTAGAEANLWHDPIAADVVLRAGFERLVLVPLDATHDAQVTRRQNDALHALGTPAAIAAAALIGERIAGYDATQPQAVAGSAPVHDALCVAYLLDPDVVTLSEYHVAIETTGVLSYGRSVIDVARRSGHRPNAHVALSADAVRFNRILTAVLGSGPAAAEG